MRRWFWLIVAITGAISGCRSCRRSEPAAASPDLARPAAAPTATAWKRPPIIDSHVHITPLPDIMNLALRIFSEVGVEKFAVKSAGSPGTMRYRATLRLAEVLGEQMAYFTNLDWEGIDEPGWGQREADKLEQALRDGASGVKIFKALGLGVRLADGKLLRVDDPRLEPIWRRAGEVGAIVAWHVADPVAFFKPVDEDNERYEELSMAPEWSFHGKDYPSHDALIEQRDSVVAKHPKTTFLGIHFANYPEDIERVARLLDRCPNMYVDVSARLGEIGRHPPEQVRQLFIKYQDRILFGTDLIVTPDGMQLGSVSESPPTFKDAIEFYAAHYRFFESAERQIDHPTPSQGSWKVDAIDLPPAVLQKLYRDNADKLIFARRRAWLEARVGAAGAAPPGQRPAALPEPAGATDTSPR